MLHLHPPDPGRGRAQVNALAESICAKSAAVIALGKAAFYKQLSMPIQDAYVALSCATTPRDLTRGLGTRDSNARCNPRDSPS